MSKAKAARVFGAGISSDTRYVMAWEDESLMPKKTPGKERKLDQGQRASPLPLLRDEPIHSLSHDLGRDRVATIELAVAYLVTLTL